MRVPVLVVNDWLALPGGTLQISIPENLKGLISEEQPIIFVLNTRFTKQPKVEDLASVGILANVERIEKKTNSMSVCFRLRRPVKLLEIAKAVELFSCDFQEISVSESSSDEEKIANDRARGVFAEFLRKIEAASEARWQEIGAEVDSSNLLNLLLSGYNTAKGERDMCFKYFSCYDKQRLVEIPSSVERLKAFTRQLCERMNCELDSPCVKFNPSDPYWLFTPQTVTFKQIGKIDCKGSLAIGCPSRIGLGQSAKEWFSLTAKKGEWSVYKAKIPSESAAEGIDEKSFYIAYVISRNKPRADWVELVSKIGEDSIEVSSGVILAVSQDLLNDQDFISDICENFSDGVASYSYNDASYQFLCIGTGGDGGYPIKIVRNSSSQLEMVVIYKEES